MSGLEVLKAHLQQSEYLHVLLNPLPVYGMAIGLFAMVLAFVLKERRAHWVAFSIIFVSAFSAWPVGELGEGGYDRVLAVADPTGDAWLKEHVARADKVIWVFYVTAGLAALSILASAKWPAAARPLFLATLLGAVASLGCGGWIGYAGGQVRHSEFRYGPPPQGRPEAEEHH